MSWQENYRKQEAERNANKGKGAFGNIDKAFGALAQPLPQPILDEETARRALAAKDKADRQALRMAEEAKRVEEGRPTKTQQAAVTMAGAIGTLFRKTGSAALGAGEYLTRGIRTGTKRRLDRVLGYNDQPDVVVTRKVVADEDVIEGDYKDID